MAYVHVSRWEFVQPNTTTALIQAVQDTGDRALRFAPNIWGAACDKTGRNALSAAVVLSRAENGLDRL
jgi:hypothetical protein